MNRIPALIAFIFIFCSCADHSKNEMAVFRATEEGLSRTNKKMNSQTEILYKSIQSKLADPRTHEQASVWQPKAEYIQQLSADITNYIEGLKSDLNKEAGFKKENAGEVIKEDDMGAVARIFGEKKKGEELYKKLVKFKENMLGADERMKQVFENNIVLVTKSFDADLDDKKDLTRYLFTDIPLIAALAMLDMIENNVRNMENEFVTYCYYQIGTGYGGYDSFSLIIGQSSNIVKGGDEIEITAGVGAFSTAANSTFIINRLKIPANVDGVAIYKFKAPLKPGKYLLPVKADYIKADGTKGSFARKIEYTVAE